MGQQQLLLVILVTIVVGIATAVAVETFQSDAQNANNTAVRKDLATIASDAQGYFMKPTMLGGGGHSFDGATFINIGFGNPDKMSDKGATVYNLNGTYHIKGTSYDCPSSTSDGMTIIAAPSRADGYDQGDATSTQGKSKYAFKARVCPGNITVDNTEVGSS